jgi:hypothetical protein
MVALIFLLSPVLFVVLTSMFFRARGDSETSRRRYFLFLIWSTLVSLTSSIVSFALYPLLQGIPAGSTVGFLWLAIAVVLLPILPGLIVLTLLHGREWNSLSRRTKVPILITSLVLVGFAFAAFVIPGLRIEVGHVERILFGALVLTATAFLFGAWKWGPHHPLFFFAITILYLVIFLTFDLGALPLFSEAGLRGVRLHLPGVVTHVAIPSMTISAMAMLIASALHASSPAGESKPVLRMPAFGRLLLVVILLGGLLYVSWWLDLWDQIDDGIRILIMLLVSAIVSLSVGMVMERTLTGPYRWAGVLFSIMMVTVIYLGVMGVLKNSSGITNLTVTEQRAARIQQAIENHKQKRGQYPLSLAQLVPGELWRIPLPMIIPQQNWCYEAGPDHYRLGAVYREHWSSPYLSVRVYASAGNVPQQNWECDEKLAEMMSQSRIFSSPPPTPVPLPTSAVATQKVIVEPILRAQSLSLGDWSPDGTYLVFGLTEYFMEGVEKVTIDLRFLEAKTGNICQPDQSTWTVTASNGLRNHSAWLPDGRLLFVSDAGDMRAFRPCASGVDDLSSRYPVTFTHAVSSDIHHGRVLLKNEEAYWLLDGISLEARRITGVSSKAYRSWYDWSPDGQRLAISWMAGPEIEDEAFLHIVDWSSGAVTTSLPIEGASDASLPLVEWLTADELLLYGGKVSVLNFRSEPPQVTDVLKDIFLLDISLHDVVSLDTVHTHDGYCLGLQINHPRNQSGYVYASNTQEVEVFQQDVSTIIFFEDGQWLRLTRWEDQPSYRDEYVLVWMDQSEAETRLKIEGHVPRTHPQIFPGYLPHSSQLFISSSQGVSLVSIPDGQTIGFWDLSSDVDQFSVIASPGEDALIVESPGDGLYYIPVPKR